MILIKWLLKNLRIGLNVITKEIKRTLLKIIFLLLLAGCTSLPPITENYYRVAIKSSKKIENELPLSCESIGRTIRNEKITVNEVTFHYPKPMSLQEARFFILQAVRISLETFRKDPAIQEYLQDQPFGINNLSIFIYMDNFISMKTPLNLYTSASIVRGEIHYKRFDIQKDDFETPYVETYEEALKKCLF